MWWNWPGIQGRAGFCSPARPRQRKGELSPLVLTLHCRRLAENLCIGISACDRKSPTCRKRLGARKKEALPSGKPLSWLLSLSLRQVAWCWMDSGGECGLSQAGCVRLGEWGSQQQPLPTLHRAEVQAPIGREKEVAESQVSDAGETAP